MEDTSNWSNIEYIVPDSDGAGYWVAVNPHLEYPGDICPIDAAPRGNSLGDSVNMSNTSVLSDAKPRVMLVDDGWGIVVNK
jgi:hypothetical protein